MTKKDEHLELLRRIDAKMEEDLSFVGNFKRGVVRGLGAAVGATVVAAIVFTILASIVDTVDDVPLLRDIIDETNLQQELNNEV